MAPSPRSPRRQEPTAKERITGLLLIIIVAVIWIAASFVVQELRLHPFLITYICNILFVVYIPVAAMQDTKRPASAAPSTGQSTETENQPVLGGAEPDLITGHSMLEVQPLCVESSPEPPPSNRRFAHSNAFNLLPSSFFSEHTWKIIRAASSVAPFWFLAQLCFNTSLHLTSVTSNTILSSPSSLFTYFLSVLILHEKFTYGKLTGVGLTVVGTVLVAFADRLVDGDKAEHPGSMPHAVIGDFLTLVAAALYAVYTVLLKVMMPEDSESDMMAFFGYLGAVNAVVFAPVLLIMQLAGSFNVFAIGRATLSVALLKGLFDNTLADYLWSRAVLLIGPTIATVALQLQVPMAMLVDPLLRDNGWWTSVSASVLELGGAATILSGFFWLNFSS